MPPDPSTPRRKLWLQIAVGIGLLVLLAWLNIWLADRGNPAAKGPAGRPPAPAKNSADDVRRTSDDGQTRPRSRSGTSASDDEDSAAAQGEESGQERALVVRNVRVKDEDGEIVYRGDVDLQPTLERIERGQRLRFSHDGIVFENRERRLPAKPTGYYHEFVQPTPGESGPGSQRLVIGSEGEVYYSPDHYRTFRHIR